MERKYFTLCLWDAENEMWYDEFCSFSRKEVAEEKTIWTQDNGVSPRHACIIVSDGTAKGMMSTRDALPAPKAYAKG